MDGWKKVGPLDDALAHAVAHAVAHIVAQVLELCFPDQLVTRAVQISILADLNQGEINH